jgi:hypothetical protein
LADADTAETDPLIPRGAAMNRHEIVAPRAAAHDGLDPTGSWRPIG